MVEGGKQQRGKIRQDANAKVSTIWQKVGLMEAWQDAGWLQGDMEGWNEETVGISGDGP